jgi:hypothetical protein
MPCHAHSCRLALASSVLKNGMQRCTLGIQDNDDTTTYLLSRTNSTARELRPVPVIIATCAIAVQKHSSLAVLSVMQCLQSGIHYRPL